MIIRRDILESLKAKLATITTTTGTSEIITASDDRLFGSDTGYWTSNIYSGNLVVGGSLFTATSLLTASTGAVLTNGLTHNIVLDIASYGLHSGIVYGNRTYLFENIGAQTISIDGDGTCINFIGTFTLNSISIMQIGSSLTYSSTIVKVHNKIPELAELSPSEFPSLAVAPLTEKVTKYDSLREHTWNLMLIGYLRTSQDTNKDGLLTVEAEKIYDDIQLLFDANPDLGIEDVVDAEVIGIAPYLDDNDTQGFFTIDIQIIYNTNF